MTDDLIVEEIGPVLCVTLNRPDKLNALTGAMMSGLSQAVAQFAEREDLRVFLIRAVGRYFCAGVDLVTNEAGPAQGGSSAVRRWYEKRMGPGMIALYDAIEGIEKPFVVAHHAPCVGGGLELSLACDFRLASRSARYMFPEAKLGSIPAAGGLSRFTHLVGQHWAKWILMAGQPIDAERGLAIGLVHEVYDDAAFDEEVMAFCHELAAQPPEMMAMAKLAIGLAAQTSPQQAHRIEVLGQSMLHLGQEAQDLLATMHDKLGRQEQ